MLFHFYMCSNITHDYSAEFLILPSDGFFFFRLLIFSSSFYLFVLNLCTMHPQVLFCSTETGRSSFVRQLEPDWHIDTNPEVLFQLAVCFLYMPPFEFFVELLFFILNTIWVPSFFHVWQRFIKYQLHVSPTRIERTAANVFSSPSLEQFFGCIWCNLKIEFRSQNSLFFLFQLITAKRFSGNPSKLPVFWWGAFMPCIPPLFLAQSFVCLKFLALLVRSHLNFPNWTFHIWISINNVL